MKWSSRPSNPLSRDKKKMNKSWVLSLLVLASAGCAAKKASVVSHPLDSNYRIAVIPFESSNPYLPGVTFSDCFTAQILRAKPGLQIVERKDLMKILQEQRLGLTGIVRSGNLSKLGAVFGADAILTGSVQTLQALHSVGGAISVTVKLMDVQTSKVIWAEHRKISHSTWYVQDLSEVADAMTDKAARRMVRKMVRALNPGALAAAKAEDNASISPTLLSLSR